MDNHRKSEIFDSISDLISLGEGFTTEFKRSVTSDLGKEICAFANATGGTVLIGVDDSGKIRGVADHNRLKSEVQSTARSANPPVTVEIESVGEILRIKVPAQHGKPYSFGGKFFIREGASSQQMSREEIREFFYSEGLIRFDETRCEKFSMENDLDEENWKLFRRRARIPEGKVRILDRRDFHADICSMINETVAWILSKINVEYVIKRVKREERPELPEEALREAVVNAFAHRDYRSAANIQIYVFKDRVEIVSPGGLPAGMTEANLGIKSIPRNPLLFSLLHRMDMVEKIGSGIRRIRDLCGQHGVPEPVIEVSDSWVITTFPRLTAQDSREVGTKSKSFVAACRNSQ